jgi:AhpD family alkylhydroperoxidase
MTEYRELIEELRRPTREFRKAVPSVWSGFTAMHDAAVADGELSRLTKELIALAIAVAQHCDGCIAYHAKAAALAGATRAQVAEALGVAMLMMGGPATSYAPLALSAFDEFAGAVPEKAGDRAGDRIAM